MKYMRLIIGIAAFCVLATIVSNFWSAAISDTDSSLAFRLLTYVNTLDGVGMIAIVLMLVLGRAGSPSQTQPDEEPWAEYEDDTDSSDKAGA